MLIEIPHAWVAKYESLAKREGISLKDTRNTRWFRTAGGEAFCGLISSNPTLLRIKSVYVFAEFRGQGFCRRLLTHVLPFSAGRAVEIVTADPKVEHVVASLGFNRTGSRQGCSLWSRQSSESSVDS